MDARPSLEQIARSTRRWVLGILVAIVVTFVAATAAVHVESQRIDRAALDISSNTAPSLEYLTDARGELRHLQKLLAREDGELAAGDERALVTLRSIADSERSLDGRLDAYFALPQRPDERAATARLSLHRAQLRTRLSALVGALGSDDERRRMHAVDRDVAGAIAELHDALTESIRVNASYTADSARVIQTLRRRADSLAVFLDIIAIVMATGGALLIRRLGRSQLEMIARDRAVHAQTAAELETFASRVAHDILSPLGAASLAIELAGKEDDRARRQKLAERGTRAVSRIKLLVEGLLEFARAGGRPGTLQSADLDATVRDVVFVLEPAATTANVELVAELHAPCSLACNPGVLTSLLSNLVNNAVKYMGDSARRVVTVRSLDAGESVRVEVADTGPGVPEAVRSHVFEPYVRAVDTKQPGIGLGLATVRRLAEAHGGKVGLDSELGVGTTFWFELPRASSTLDASATP